MCVRGAVLDEATSQVSVAMERELYSTCARLDITVMSVGHRDTLRHFHHQQLYIDHRGHWTLRPIDSASSDQLSINED